MRPLGPGPLSAGRASYRSPGEPLVAITGCTVVKGPWPAPVVDVLEPVAAKYAADWPAWGHRKLHWLMRADGHTVSASSVERALRRRDLLQPVDYQGERRAPAKARKAAFADPPSRPNEIWQLDSPNTKRPAEGSGGRPG
jgi:hypothetical protein